jgi:hypothetical protein
MIQPDSFKNSKDYYYYINEDISKTNNGLKQLQTPNRNLSFLPANNNNYDKITDKIGYENKYDLVKQQTPLFNYNYNNPYYLNNYDHYHIIQEQQGHVPEKHPFYNKNINGSVYTGNENKKFQKQNPNDFVMEKRGNVEINKGIMINNNDYNNDYNINYNNNYNNNYNINNNNNDSIVNYHNINNNINNNNINNNINNNNEINYEYKPVIPNNNNINNNFSIPQLDDNIYNNPMFNRFRPKTSTVTINQNQNYSINEINEKIPSLNSRVTPRNFVQKLNYLDDNQINSTNNNNNNNNINNNINNNEKNINSYDKYLRRNYSSQNFSDNINNNNNNNNNNQKINNIDMIEYKKQLQQREAELIGKYNNNYSKYKKELDEQRFKLNENFSHQNNISYLNTKDENVPYYIKNHAKKDQIPTNPFNLRENDLGPSFLSDNPILYPSNTYKFDIRRLTPNSYYNKKY